MKVLKIASSETRLWGLLLERAGGGDQFHLSGYAEALALERGGEAQAVWFESESGCVFYPFIRISSPLHVPGRSDIESPYGYSGPVYSVDQLDLRVAFRLAFHEFCEQEGIVCEFTRENPFLPSAQDAPGENGVSVQSSLYVADLSMDESGLWSGMRKGHRQSVKKAASDGVVVRKSRLTEFVRPFATMYRETMIRNHAAQEYMFGETFFRAVDSACGDSLDLWIAERQGRDIAFALVLRNKEWAHYYLSAVSHEGRLACATHLLLWSAMVDLRASSCLAFNLGGAPLGDASLDSFKKGFTKRTVPFTTVRRVHDQNEFIRLCRLARVAESLDGYFPPYQDRAILASRAPFTAEIRIPIVIYGAGAHSAVVADVIEQAAAYAPDQRGYRVEAYLDDDQDSLGRRTHSAPVVGGSDQTPIYLSDHAFIVAVGENHRRRSIYESLQQRGARFGTALHPSAVIAPDVAVGDGTVVCARAVINPGSTIGENVILNTGCTVDHHNRIGAHAHIAPGAHLGGEVTVGEGVLVGIGAAVLPGLVIGDWATIGAGAVVTKNVPAATTVVGVPAVVVGDRHPPS